MDRKTVLLETLEYFSTHPRSINYDEDGEWGMCTYSGTLSKFNTEGCAVGRLLDADLRRKLDITYGEQGVHLLWDHLPQHIQELGQDFLLDLSLLHDTCEFWNAQQLTEEGEDFIEEIMLKYQLK